MFVMQKWLKEESNYNKMDKDTLKISQNEDGSFNVDWDKNDPEWKWLNKLSSKEIQLFIEDAIKYDKKN